MMRASIVGLIFVSIASFGGVVFGCESSGLKEETAKQSAITQALAFRDNQLTKHLEADIKKAENELGVARSWSISKINFINFVARVYKNKKLREALMKAKEAKIDVYVGSESKVFEDGFISIDHRASDEEIISFLLVG